MLSSRSRSPHQLLLEGMTRQNSTMRFTDKSRRQIHGLGATEESTIDLQLRAQPSDSGKNLENCSDEAPSSSFD